MITITINNIQTLNNSLQVGDMVYATTTMEKTGAFDSQNPDNSPVGVSKLVGLLRLITISGSDVELDIDETPFVNPYNPLFGDFLMFSKYSQTDGDINGYYAEATFKNNSTDKAELFSIGSEVIINSK